MKVVPISVSFLKGISQTFGQQVLHCISTLKFNNQIKINLFYLSQPSWWQKQIWCQCLYEYLSIYLKVLNLLNSSQNVQKCSVASIDVQTRYVEISAHFWTFLNMFNVIQSSQKCLKILNLVWQHLGCCKKDYSKFGLMLLWFLAIFSLKTVL